MCHAPRENTPKGSMRYADAIKTAMLSTKLQYVNLERLKKMQSVDPVCLGKKLKGKWCFFPNINELLITIEALLHTYALMFWSTYKNNLKKRDLKLQELLNCLFFWTINNPHNFPIKNSSFLRNKRDFHQKFN